MLMISGSIVWIDNKHFDVKMSGSKHIVDLAEEKAWNPLLKLEKFQEVSPRIVIPQHHCFGNIHLSYLPHQLHILLTKVT